MVKKLEATSSKLKAKEGQSLAETLVALGIITVCFLAILALLSQSLFYNRIVADDYVATYLAAEGVEIVKNIVDSNFLQSRLFNTGLDNGDYEALYSNFSLRPYLGAPILFDQSAGFYGYDGAEQTRFTRRIRILNIDLDGDFFADVIRANSIVEWVAGGGAQKTVNLEDEFYCWRPACAP